MVFCYKYNEILGEGEKCGKCNNNYPDLSSLDLSPIFVSVSCQLMKRLTG